MHMGWEQQPFLNKVVVLPEGLVTPLQPRGEGFFCSGVWGTTVESMGCEKSRYSCGIYLIPFILRVNHSR